MMIYGLFCRDQSNASASSPPDCLLLRGMVGLTAWATMKEGAHIERLLHPVDYAGRICGVSPGVEDKPFVYVCGKAGAGFEARDAFSLSRPSGDLKIH